MKLKARQENHRKPNGLTLSRSGALSDLNIHSSKRLFFAHEEVGPISFAFVFHLVTPGSRSFEVTQEIDNRGMCNRVNKATKNTKAILPKAPGPVRYSAAFRHIRQAELEKTGNLLREDTTLPASTATSSHYHYNRQQST